MARIILVAPLTALQDSPKRPGQTAQATSQCEIKSRHLKFERACETLCPHTRSARNSRAELRLILEKPRETPDVRPAPDRPRRAHRTTPIRRKPKNGWTRCRPSSTVKVPSAHFLIEEMIEHARQHGIDLPFSATTGYVNTIGPSHEARCPGNIQIEKRLRAYMRWNAMAMVVRANRLNPADGGDLGGHIGSSPRWRPDAGRRLQPLLARRERRPRRRLHLHPGPQRPGVYARAYLEGPT